MRGRENRQTAMFCGIETGHSVPADHPLRPIKTMVDAELARLNEG